MRLALVFGVVGQQMRLFSFAFVPPLLLALFDRHWQVAAHFGASLAIGLVAGTLLGIRFRATRVFYRSEALAVVAFTWLTVGILAAVPYVFAGLRPVDAFFEAISGLTTTGATILMDFSDYDRAFFLWRAMTQWFGGLGVIALFVVILPRLGIAGRQLFFAEASGAPGEAISPQARMGARKLWVLYVVLTVVLVVALLVAGMDLYEAVLHALTTLSAGGFSPHPQSIAGYDNAIIDWVLVVFMTLAGTSFTLQWRVFTGQQLSGFFRDREFLFYFGIGAAGALATACLLAGGIPGEPELREAAFQSASLMSSTGYASVDYNLWVDPARAVLVVVMVVGGCAGSAAGGPKAVRFFLVTKHVGREVTRVLHPRAVIPLRYGSRRIPLEVMRAVFTLVALYLFGYFTLGVVMVVLGQDLVTGFTAALACLGNIGPGYGVVGPMGSYAGFSDTAKVLLTLGMWIGRLEIVTVLALMHPDVWRHLRLGYRERKVLGT